MFYNLLNEKCSLVTKNNQSGKKCVLFIFFLISFIFSIVLVVSVVSECKVTNSYRYLQNTHSNKKRLEKKRWPKMKALFFSFFFSLIKKFLCIHPLAPINFYWIIQPVLCVVLWKIDLCECLFMNVSCPH